MREVLKLALDALEIYGAQAPAVRQTITAIKEALAQPDYRAVKTYHEGKPVYVSQPEQEPVAWTVVGDGKFGEVEIGQHAETDLDACRYWVSRGYSIVPLYTTPPKEQQSCDKRPWVGLTDDEIDLAWPSPAGTNSIRAVAKAIEAKLKEKNT